MSFCIVQTRKTKKSLPSMTVVPANWVEDKFVFWPPSNLISLSKNENSIPEKLTWKKQKCKLAGRAQTFQLAEEMMALLEKVTDSEDAVEMGHGTRTTPARKQPKFKSKSYKLAPPAAAVADDGAPSSKIAKVTPSEDISHQSTPNTGPEMLVVNMNSATASEPKVASSKCRLTDPRLHAVFDTGSNTMQLDSNAPIPSAISADRTSAQLTFPKQFSIRSQSSTNAQPLPVNVVSTHDAHTSAINAVSNTRSISTPGTCLEIMNSAATATLTRNTASALPQQVQNSHTGSVTGNKQAGSVYNISSDSIGTNSVHQPISIPVVMGNDGIQYAQLANGYYYALTDSSEAAEAPTSNVIKQDEVDLGIDNELNSFNSPSPALDDSHDVLIELRKINDRLNNFERNLSEIASELRKANDRLDVQEGLLVKTTEFMANFNRLMAMKNMNDATPIANRQEEDFSEFENIPKIDSDESFKAFERGLAERAFSEKFFRYLHSIYSLNGKRDSGPLFRTIMRKLLAPNVLIPYSWKGNKRTKKGSTGDSGANMNFQETFPNFIKTIHQVLHAADYSTTREQNDNLFKNLLRYKVLELKRYESGNGERRASSSRKRQKRQVKEDTAPVESANHANHDEPCDAPSKTFQEAQQLLPLNQSQSSENSSENESGTSDDASFGSDE